SFTYRAVDRLGNTSPLATVRITVAPRNDAPVADDQSVSTPLDTAVAVRLSASDVDGDALAYVVDTDPTHGALTGAAPDLTYTPNTGFVGTDSFTYRVDDGSIASNVATVTMMVTAISDPEALSFQDGMLPTPGYSGTQDAGVRGDKLTSNYGSRDALWLDGNPDQTAFVRWDLSSIPAGSIVQSASITINVENRSVHTFRLYELLAPWVEDEVTFNERSSGTPWQVAGAQGENDRGSMVLGTVTAPDRGEVVITLNRAGVQAVQGWIDHPSQNDGIVFQNFDNASTDDLDFTSSEGRDPRTRPKLTIRYAPTATSHVASSALRSGSLRNGNDPYGVNDGERVSPLDALLVTNYVSRPLIAATEGKGNVSIPPTTVVIDRTRLAVGQLYESSNRKSPPPINAPGFWVTQDEFVNAHLKPTPPEEKEDVLSLDLEAALQLIATTNLEIRQRAKVALSN
ncbi:MAG: DNRLRE domain-containing protein, partial [Pirellulaceae bacterium]